MQNPDDFIVLDPAGLVSNGFITEWLGCYSLYGLVISFLLLQAVLGRKPLESTGVIEP
jgi:hypothetical protein